MPHAASPPTAAAHRLATATGVLASYAVFFGIVLWPWIQVATYGAPAGHNSNVEDRWLVPWIIGWVGHVLTVAPWRLFDVPINHPVPAQLAAIEHFLSSSIAALPVLGATGNAVLATNVVAIASYPLAALCMNRLLVALGCSALAAWVAGVAFALGPERVPGNVMSLKYPNLYLPLVALCLTRLREQPDVGRAAWLALALTLALLSSYYLAVLVLFAAGIWGLCELARRSPDRARYLGWAIAAAIAALAVLAVISIPYFARPEAILSGEGDRISPIRMMLNRYLLGMRVWGLGNLQVYIAAAALLLVAAARPVGLLARRGALIAAIALALMLGPQQVLFGREVTLPFALLAESPASFFRYPFRFSVLWGFGAALLVAATLEAMRRRLPGALGSSVIAAVAALTLEGQLRRAAGTGVEEYVSIRQPVYAAVRDVAAADGTGPLLELPHDPGFRVGEAPRVEIQSMLGWTIHRQPLILGYVDFPPLQRRWINGAISRLPAGNAIDDLKSMTGLKWLLLQPRAVWREPEQRDRLMRHGGMTMMLSQDGWDLLRIDRPVRHPEWLAHVAAGKQPDATIVGTPIRKLQGGAAKALVGGNLPAQIEAGSFALHKLSVLNVGTAIWPSAAPPSPGLVRYEVRWWPENVDPTPRNAVRTRRYALPRDLSPGERMDFMSWLTSPRKPGRYRVEIKIVQGANNPFDGPDNQRLVGFVRVLPRRDRPDGAGPPPRSRADTGAVGAAAP